MRISSRSLLAVAVVATAAGVASPPRPAEAAKPVTAVAISSPSDFGSVTVGKTATQSLTIVNSGTTTTSTPVVATAGSTAFSITASTCSAIAKFKPGASCSATVQFAPTSAGPVSGSVSVSTAKPTSRVSVILSGTGAAAEHLFWTAGGSIVRADLDGTHQTSLPSGSDVCQVAVFGGHLYWTNETAGTVVRADLDGTNQTVLASGLTYPCGIAVDASSIYIGTLDYYQASSGFTPGYVERVSTDGTGTVTQFPPSIDGSFPSVAVSGGHVYLAGSPQGGYILMANLDGTNQIAIGSGSGVAADATHVYWTYSLVDSGTRAIVESGLDGTNQLSISTPNMPYSVATDGSHLFWVGSNFSNGSDTIMEANPDGTGQSTLVTAGGISQVAVG